MDEVAIDVDHGFIDADGRPAAMLSLVVGGTTLLVCLAPRDVDHFASVEGRRWEDGSIRIGSCVAAPVFWSMDDGKLTCLVGSDDQTWDVALAMPRETLPRIVAALRARL